MGSFDLALGIGRTLIQTPGAQTKKAVSVLPLKQEHFNTFWETDPIMRLSEMGFIQI